VQFASEDVRMLANFSLLWQML